MPPLVGGVCVCVCVCQCETLGVTGNPLIFLHNQGGWLFMHVPAQRRG